MIAIKDDKDKVLVGVYVSQADRARLRAIAARSERSASGELRMLIAEHLRRHEDGGRQCADCAGVGNDQG